MDIAGYILFGLLLGVCIIILFGLPKPARRSFVISTHLPDGRILLRTESGYYVSNDGGHSWKPYRWTEGL